MSSTVKTSVTNQEKTQSTGAALPTSVKAYDLKDVGCDNSAGSGTALARVDHTHKGIRSIGVVDQRFGDLKLQAGTGVTITDNTVDECQPILTIASTGGGGASQAYMHARNTASQSIPNGVQTAVIFNTTDSSANVTKTSNTVFQPTIVGWYTVSASVFFDISSGTKELFLQTNDNIVHAGSSGLATGLFGSLNASSPIFFDGTRTLRALVQQNSGGAVLIGVTQNYYAKIHFTYLHA